MLNTIYIREVVYESETNVGLYPFLSIKKQFESEHKLSDIAIYSLMNIVFLVIPFVGVYDN